MARKPDFRLYQITDRKLFRNTDEMISVIEVALDAGLKALQMREKDLSDMDAFDLASRLRILTQRYKAKLFINERVDIALCSGADGVHLGFSGMPLEAARRVAGDRLMIGVSTHSIEQAKSAEAEGADFITFGPVYATPSKLKYGPPVGIAALKAAAECVKIPVFALGSVDSGNIDEVKRSGAYGAAVIRAGLMSSNIKKFITDFENISGDNHDKN